MKTQVLASAIISKDSDEHKNDGGYSKLTISSLLGFNTSLGQGLNLRGRKTMDQRSIMARMLRLARNRWSRHLEKGKGERERREEEWKSIRSRQSGQPVGELRFGTMLCLGGVAFHDHISFIVYKSPRSLHANTDFRA